MTQRSFALLRVQMILLPCKEILWNLWSYTWYGLTWLLKFYPDKYRGHLSFLMSSTGLSWNTCSEKDLGLHVDGQLCFDAHIYDKISKTNSLLGLIRRSFTCLSQDIVLPLHKGLWYGGVLWNTIASRAQLRAVAKVQMRALDIVDGMDGKTYEKQLIALNLTTLS